MNLLYLVQIPLRLVQLPYIYSKTCYRYYKKKNKLRESGYIVDPPLEYFFHPERYSVYQRHIWDVTTYTKYGRTYTYEEIIRGDHKLIAEHKLNRESLKEQSSVTLDRNSRCCF